MYELFGTFGARNSYDNEGGTVGYSREGFLPVQNAITNAYVKLISNAEMPDIVMQVSTLSRIYM